MTVPSGSVTRCSLGEVPSWDWNVQPLPRPAAAAPGVGRDTPGRLGTLGVGRSPGLGSAGGAGRLGTLGAGRSPGLGSDGGAGRSGRSGAPDGAHWFWSTLSGVPSTATLTWAHGGGPGFTVAVAWVARARAPN